MDVRIGDYVNFKGEVVSTERYRDGFSSLQVLEGFPGTH